MSTTTLVMAEEAAPKTETLEFQALYEQYSGAVYLTALRVTGNPADAEDVLQTVFLHVLDARRALDASRSPGAYVRRAAANASSVEEASSRSTNSPTTNMPVPSATGPPR